MQHGKCCYCEEYVGDPEKVEDAGADRHVEHFRPKNCNCFPELTNDWGNLLLACGQCNVQKGTKFPEDDKGPLIIDPTDPNIDPELHIEFYVDDRIDGGLLGQIKARDRSKYGEETIEATNLRDNSHAKKRIKKINEAKEHIFNVQHAPTQAQRTAFLDVVRSLAQDDAEYAGVVRCMARKHNLQI